MAQPETTNSLPRLAMLGTAALVALHFIGWLMSGVERLVHAIEEGGLFFAAQLLWLVIGGGIIAIAGAKRMRGQNVPLAALTLLAFVPLALGLAGSFLAVGSLVEGLWGDPSMRSTMVARASAQTILQGMGGTAATATLLAGVALIAGLEGLRGVARNRMAAISVPAAWVIASIAGVLAASVLHPDAYPSLRFLSIALGVAAVASGLGAAGLAASADTPSGRQVISAITAPLLGIAIAYLTAYQVRLSDGMTMFAAVAGADSSSRIAMFDQGLFEAGEMFYVSLMLTLGPVAGLVLVLGFARRSLGQALAKRALGLGALVLVLVAAMGSAAIQHSFFVQTIIALAGAQGGLPDTDVRLPQVDSREALSGGSFIVFSGDVRVDDELIGPRGGPYDTEILGELGMFGPITLLADASVTMPELLSFLAAATGEESAESLDVEVVVESSAHEPMVGPLRDLEPPPAVVRFTYSARTIGTRHLYVAPGTLTLDESGERGPIELYALAWETINGVSVDPELSFTELLRTLAAIGCCAHLTPTGPAEEAEAVALEELEGMLDLETL